MNNEDISEVKEFCKDLSIYIQSRYNYKRQHGRVLFGKSVNVSTGKIKLHLRYDYKLIFPDNTLVISKIEFSKTRVGNASDLIKFFISIGDKYSVECIGVENVFSESMLLFVQKYGFISLDTERCYYIKIADLMKCFNKSGV